MAQTSPCLVQSVPKAASRPPSAPTPLPHVSLVLPATTAPATALSILRLAPLERTARTTDRHRRKTAVIVLPVRTARSLADSRSRAAVQARGHLRWGPSQLPFVRRASPAHTPARQPQPTSRHALLALPARTRPRLAPPPTRHVKRAPLGSSVLWPLRLRSLALSARSCPPLAPVRWLTAAFALPAGTVRSQPRRLLRCARLARTLHPRVHSATPAAWIVLPVRTASPTA
jgi:hypothetical protein